MNAQLHPGLAEALEELLTAPDEESAELEALTLELFAEYF